MLHCCWNVPELRPRPHQPRALLLTNHVQKASVCLEAVLINYAHSVAIHVLECALSSPCTVSVCLRESLGEQQGCGVAQDRAVINLTQ